MAGKRIWVAVGVAVAAVGLSGPAGAAAKTATTLTLEDASYSGGQTEWWGEVSSPKRSCADDRKVTLFRARAGQDQKIASTRSFPGTVGDGIYWVYEQQGQAPAGRYYAKAAATKRCAGAMSRKIQLG